MSQVIIVQYKKTEPVDLTTPLRQYITTNYSTDPNNFIEDFTKLEQLRNEVASIASPSSTVNEEASKTKLLQYFHQLSQLTYKFPFEDGRLPITFSWYGTFGNKKPVHSGSVHYEKLCVLFNIAALHIHIAAKHSSRQSDAIKRSCQAFQYAAGIFAYAREYTTAHPFSATIGGNVLFVHDVHPTVLTAFEHLMLAQAQECFVQKAILDEKEVSIISKLAVDMARLYDTSLAFLADSVVKAALFEVPNDWIHTVQGKSHLASALANHFKAQELSNSSHYGNSVARLQMAESILKRAVENQPKLYQGTFLKDLQQWYDQMKIAYTQGLRDNDIIYHDAVPNIQSLDTLPGVQMAQSNPLPELADPNMIPGPWLFERLVPYWIQVWIQAYNERRDRYVQDAIKKFREATDLYQASLASMNLPAAIEAFEKPTGLPDSTLRQSMEVRADGGIQKMCSSYESIIELHNVNQRLVGECSHSLQEEEEEDQQMRQQFCERWIRAPSRSLSTGLFQEIERYQQKLDTAKNSNQVIQKKLEQHYSSLEWLSASREELDRRIPSNLSSSSPMVSANEPILIEIKRHLQHLEDIGQRQREQLFQKWEQTRSNDRVEPRLLAHGTSLTGGPSSTISMTSAKDDQESFFREELQSHYHTLVEQTDRNVHEQSKALDQLVNTNERWIAQRRGLSTSLSQREMTLQNLNNAYQAFHELRNHLQEGIRFYHDINSVLSALKRRIDDLVFARKMEVRDWLSRLQSNVTAPIMTPGMAMSIGNTSMYTPPPQYQMTNSLPPQWMANANRIPYATSFQPGNVGPLPLMSTSSLMGNEFTSVPPPPAFSIPSHLLPPSFFMTPQNTGTSPSQSYSQAPESSSSTRPPRTR